MKKYLAFAIIGLFLSAYSAYGTSLKLSESSIDFGNVKEGPPVTKTIIITNKETAPVRIANTSTSCACTSVKLTKSNLRPGESTELLIKYNTYKYPGKFDKTVVIFTGPEGKKKTVIHLLGNVEPIPMGVIAMKPRKTEVGELNLNKNNKVRIVLENTGDAPLTLTRIYSSKYKTEYFSSGKSGGIKIAAGRQKTMELTVTPTKPGRFLDRIFIFSDARNDIGSGYKGLLSGTAK